MKTEAVGRKQKADIRGGHLSMALASFVYAQLIWSALTCQRFGRRDLSRLLENTGNVPFAENAASTA
jgi:acid phosphatase family membrane protein YuiD